MDILIACEESQRVCIAFREKGHQAFSCDIQECSGNHPEWHIKSNVLDVLNPVKDFDEFGNEISGIAFFTCDKQIHIIGKWDLIIAFPPCTYLCVTGNRWFNVERYGDKAIKRIEERKKAINFFMNFVNADCEKIAIENPIGVMSTVYRKPDQIIQPYMFGEKERKATCLWLKNLPNLKSTKIVKPNIIVYNNGKGTDSFWHMETLNLPKNERQKERSKTFLGVAKAIAEQWG